MKAVLHFLKKLLNDKYPHADFNFYLSRCAQNVHMGLNYSLLTLHDYEQFIFDIEELWLIKRHAVKWKFDYIIFRKITENGNNWMQNIPKSLSSFSWLRSFPVETKVLKPWGRTLIKLDLSRPFQRVTISKL